MTSGVWPKAGMIVAAMTSIVLAQGGSRRAVSPPVISSIFPPGATLGTTVDWTLSGRGFSRGKQLIVSGQGVKLIQFSAKNDTQAIATVKVDPKAVEGYREIRIEGTDGISNLVLVRIDSKPQVIETEPNDEPGTAQTIEIGTAVAGVLRATDVDHYRVEGSPGREVTVDFEARRLGTSITPVMTILNRGGAAIAQARESRSKDHDCRMAVKIPGDGVFLIQVRDNTYAGNDSASYRLQITPIPFATGLFPLGGPKGERVTVSASGGSLKTSLSKTIMLPAESGKNFDPGPFESPDGLVESPGTILIGSDHEIQELVAPGQPTPIRLGETANGRIDGRNEVDRYTIAVSKGQKFRIAVHAEPLGSWLDSVLTVKNSKGILVAENDDFATNPNGQSPSGVNQFGLTEGTIDSAVDVEAGADDTFTIEVSDRFGDGGPEYGYRLSVGTTRPDFAVNLLIGNPNANGQVFNTANNRMIQIIPGQFGVFNLAAGTKVPINFIVIPEGRPGPVTIRVEGLPDGVSVDRVKVDILGPGEKGGQPTTVNAPPRADNLVLNVAPYAYPGMSELQIVATAEPVAGVTLSRTATAVIGLEAVPSNVPARPITRRIDRFPIRVVGEYRPKLVGPPEAPRLVSVRVPGVLLAGDRIDLGLDFDSSPLSDPDFKFDARASGVGLATNTVILSGSSVPDSEEENPGDVIVRILASPKAVPGVYPVTISYALSGGKPITREVSVIVRRPIEVLSRRETIEIKPGGSGSIWVGVRRQPGAAVEIDLRLEDLPRGVRLKRPITLKEMETEAILEFEMAANAKPLTKPGITRIVAIARMPRGAVSVECGNRPMLVGGSVE